MIRARAFSSIANLGHGFDVFAVCVDAGWDEVELGPGRRGFELTVRGQDVPGDPRQNTAGCAVTELMRDHRIREPIHLRLHKGIRPGSGLGSSAASAAAAVAAANAYFRLDLPLPALVHYAAQGEMASAGVPHADNVTAALYGGFTICTRESPPRVLQVRPPPMRFVIAVPRFELTTREARSVLPAQVSLAEHSQGCARSAMIAVAIAAGDLVAFGRAIEGSFVEARRAPLIPGYREVCDGARRAGAAGVTISGAGPSIAAVVDVHADAAAVGRAMQAGFAAARIESDAIVASVAGGVEVAA